MLRWFNLINFFLSRSSICSDACNLGGYAVFAMNKEECFCSYLWPHHVIDVTGICPNGYTKFGPVGDLDIPRQILLNVNRYYMSDKDYLNSMIDGLNVEHNSTEYAMDYLKISINVQRFYRHSTFVEQCWMMLNRTESYQCEVLDSSLVSKSKISILLLREFKLIERGTIGFILNSHSDIITSSYFSFNEEKSNSSKIDFQFNIRFEEKASVPVDVGFDIGFSVVESELDADILNETSDSVLRNIFNRALSSKTLTSSKVTEFSDVLKNQHSLSITLPHKNELKVQINRSFLKEINRWEARFSVFGTSELTHQKSASLPLEYIESILLHETLEDRFMTYGTIDYEHESRIVLTVSFAQPEVAQAPKISRCFAYQCEEIVFVEKDFYFPSPTMPNENPNQNISQQLLDCNSEKENFKLGFIISAGVAFILLIISVSLVINAIRVNHHLERYSAFESTSW